jgi:hypothetical protein
LTQFESRYHSPEEQTEEFQKMRQLAAELDESVADAYGWADLKLEHDFREVPYLPVRDRTRFTISEKARSELLGRLGDLNRECSEAETSERLQGKKRSMPRDRKRATSPSGARRLLRYGPTQRHLFPVSRQRDLLDEVAEEASTYDARGSSADDGDGASSQILEWFIEHPGWHARADVLADLDLNAFEWFSGTRALVDTGKLERKGRRRGTRYRVSSFGDQGAAEPREDDGAS